MSSNRAAAPNASNARCTASASRTNASVPNGNWVQSVIVVSSSTRAHDRGAAEQQDVNAERDETPQDGSAHDAACFGNVQVRIGVDRENQPDQQGTESAGYERQGQL